MARGQNRVILIGLLGGDPEMRYTPKGQPVTSFNLSTRCPAQPESGDHHEPKDCFNVVTWGPLAEACRSVLNKNSRSYVEGHLQTRHWKNADGESRVRAEVVASRVIPLDANDTSPHAEPVSDVMPACLNLGLLIGNLGHDPELRHAPDGQAVACFSLAVSRPWTTADGEKHDATEWFNVIARGSLAEICHQHLCQGRRVYVEGEIRIAAYTDQDGTVLHGAELVASDMIILGPRPSVQAQGE
jgi:single-strand DNA-binding protein